MTQIHNPIADTQKGFRMHNTNIGHSNLQEFAAAPGNGSTIIFHITGPQPPSLENQTSLQAPVKVVKVKSDSSRGLLVLGILTVSVCICWTPNNIFYSMALYKMPDDDAFNKAQIMLFIVQNAVDPFIFIQVLPSLRDGLYRFITRLCRPRWLWRVVKFRFFISHLAYSRVVIATLQIRDISLDP